MKLFFTANIVHYYSNCELLGLIYLPASTFPYEPGLQRIENEWTEDEWMNEFISAGKTTVHMS